MTNDAYYIDRHLDGTCDVIIYDDLRVYECEHGQEYDLDEYTLRGVPYHDWLEENIREHYEAWKAHAIAYEGERAAMIEAFDGLIRNRRKDVTASQMMCQNCMYYQGGLCCVNHSAPTPMPIDGYCHYYDFDTKLKAMVSLDDYQDQAHPPRKRGLLRFVEWVCSIHRHRGVPWRRRSQRGL